MSNITPDATERCSRKPLREQLEDCRRQMQRESGAGDSDDVMTAFQADHSWSGQHARLANPKGFEPYEPHTD